MRTVTDLKRQEILKAASKVFAKRGFQKTLMEDVAGQAGIGKGTIYRYFPGKEDLYFSILDQAISDLTDCLSRDVRKKEPPEAKLRKMVSDMTGLLMNNRSLMVLLHEIEGSKMKTRHAHFKQNNAKIDDLVAGVIADGIRQKLFKRGDPSFMAVQLGFMVKVAVMEFPGKKNDYLVNQIMDMYLHGISNK